MYYTNIFNDGFVEDFLDELFGGTGNRGCAPEKKPEVKEEKPADDAKGDTPAAEV